MVIHLGFASQAEGGELKQQHKMAFMSQFTVRCVYKVFTGSGFSRAVCELPHT